MIVIMKKMKIVKIISKNIRKLAHEDKKDKRCCCRASEV